MVGAPDVDQRIVAAVDLDLVICDVAREIRVAAVRFQQRAVDVVAELCRAEQCLVAILPVVGQLALGRREATDIDEVLGAQEINRRLDLVAALAARQRTLGEEDFVRDVERGKIRADHVHHRIDGEDADGFDPILFRLAPQARAIFFRKTLADGHQIIAGIEAFRNFADVLAERLSVAQVR